MGCCETKEDEFRPIYAYKQLTWDESRMVLRKKPVQCTLCQQLIIQPYESMTECTSCHTILGHSRCISMYRMSNDRCPACKK
jgi:hypothetical protein